MNQERKPIDGRFPTHCQAGTAVPDTEEERERIRRELKRLQNEATQHTIAYARVYYLDEPTMAERYGLGTHQIGDECGVASSRGSLTSPLLAAGSR